MKHVHGDVHCVVVERPSGRRIGKTKCGTCDQII
jgi:hypothetical protein